MVRRARVGSLSGVALAAVVLGMPVFLAQSPAAPQHISFSTRDAALIHADAYGAGRHGVVLAHGGQFNKESWQEQVVPVLVKAGFRVLSQSTFVATGSPALQQQPRMH
jgi:hypothetical protein